MGIDYTTDALVTSVKRRITVPTSQQFFLPSNIVQFANDEMHSTILPSIISVREEYFVKKKDFAIVSGSNEFQIPSRATGGMMRDVVLVNASGNEVAIPRLQPETTKSDTSLSNARLSGFMLRDDKVLLYPNSSAFTNATLRIYYMRRPNDLVIRSLGGVITNINTTTNEVTVSAAPTTWTTATTFDFIKGSPIFSSAGDSHTINNLAGNVLTFDTLPTDIAIGDWLCEATFTPIAQIPYEGHHVLAQYTAARMLEAQGDKANAQVILEVASRMLEGFLKIITPRTEASMKKINNRSGIFAYSGMHGFESGN